MQIDRQLGDRGGEAVVLGNLGAAYAANGDVQKAIPHYQKQLSLARELGDMRTEANALNNLGAAHSTKGEKSKALAYYEQTLAVVEKLIDKRAQSRVLERALEIARQIEEPGIEAATLFNFGMVFSWLADWTKAAEFFRQALAIDRRLQNKVSEVLTLRALANACEKVGQFDEAREAVEALAKLQKTD